MRYSPQRSLLHDLHIVMKRRNKDGIVLHIFQVNWFSKPFLGKDEGTCRWTVGVLRWIAVVGSETPAGYALLHLPYVDPNRPFSFKRTCTRSKKRETNVFAQCFSYHQLVSGSPAAQALSLPYIWSFFRTWNTCIAYHSRSQSVPSNIPS